MLNFLWHTECNYHFAKRVPLYTTITLLICWWKSSIHHCSLVLTSCHVPKQLMLHVFFSICWPKPSYVFITVCHHWRARYSATCHWPVKENPFKGAAWPSGKAAFKKLDMQSSDWKRIWGVDLPAVIPITYSKMGWYAIGWFPPSFSWGIFLSFELIDLDHSTVADSLPSEQFSLRI